jgi:hypothetical protein
MNGWIIMFFWVQARRFSVVYVAGHHFGHIMLHNNYLKIIYRDVLFVKRQKRKRRNHNTTYFFMLLHFYSIKLVGLLKLNSYRTTHKE